MGRKRNRFYYAIAIGIIALGLGLEWYWSAPKWGWKAMLLWLPFIALVFWGSHVGLSFLIPMLNRRVMPHVIRLLDRWQMLQ